MQYRAIAPGKIILSGEHAVVHGNPALAMAVNRHTTCTLSVRQGPPGCSFRFPAIDINKTYTLEHLRQSVATIRERRTEFEAGNLAIESVSGDAAGLMAYSLNLVLERAPCPGSLEFSFDSAIPSGSGMGGSAALILSLLKATAAAVNLSLDNQTLFQLALECENLQHGKSSGVDPFTCLHGGCLRFRNGRAESVLNVGALRFFLVHTGKPEVSTGTCVMEVTRKFGASDIWKEFAAATARIERGLTTDPHDLLPGIRENHRLLQKIGVVPGRVADFIREVENAGGAAKVCGAGAVRGEAGGMVIVFPNSECADLCDELCRPFGYTPLPADIEPAGVRMQP